MGRPAAVVHGALAASEPDLIHEIRDVGVHHGGRVDAFQGASPGHDLLAALALFRGGAQIDNPAGKRGWVVADELDECDERAQSGHGNHVVTAAVADAGQGVVLGHDRDGAVAFRVEVFGGDLRTDGGVEPEGGILRGNVVGLEMGENLLHGKVFLERRLGVLVQFVQYAVQVGGLIVDQGFEALVQFVRSTRVVGQVMLQLVLTALSVPFELLQIRA